MTSFDAIPMVPTGALAPEDGSAYAVMQGELVVDGQSLRVYQLNNGQRVINAEDISSFFGFQIPGEGE